MRKEAMYRVNTPSALQDEFMGNDFYIAKGPNSQKVAHYWQNATHGEKYTLLKRAEELEDDDITSAYEQMTRKSRNSVGSDENSGEEE